MIKSITRVSFAVVAVVITLGSLTACRAGGDDRNSRLITYSVMAGELGELSAVGGVPLSLRSDGCVMAGDSVVVAPQGSEVKDGSLVDLKGIGVYRIGERLPSLAGVILDPSNSQTRPWREACKSERYMKLYPNEEG